MEPVKVRNVVIGEGVPKICVPIVGETREEILKEAEGIVGLLADVVEWRVDWYEAVSDFAAVKETMAALREILGEIPILFTFRTAKEGGEKEIPLEHYIALNELAICSGLVDLIDVELFTGDETVQYLVSAAHAAGVKVVASNHDFEKTPSKEEMVLRLRKMQELGADIPKIAVMPQSKKDVLTLLAATEEMASRYANRPIITISMGQMGMLSRLCGEVFGSALTFGSAKKASAPGQIGTEDLDAMLQVLHKSIEA